MDNFNWNSADYTQEDLEEMFQLNYLPNYTEKKVLEQIEKVAKKLLVKEDTPQIRDFLEQAKHKLLNKNNLRRLIETYENVYNVNKELEPSEITEAGGTMIIQKPVTPYGQSQPSEFYQGTLNPLNPRILRKFINIDTKFRENYYATQSTNFHVTLPTRFSDVVSIQLTAMELPTTFYNISKTYGNNYLWITLNNTQLSWVVPDGYYNFAQLVALFNSQFSANSIAIATNFATNLNPTTFTYIGVGTGFGLNFQLNANGQEDKITPLPLKLGWLLGFRQGKYIDNTTYVSEGIADFTNPRYLYLVVDDFHVSINDGFYAAFNASLLKKNILARISMNYLVNPTTNDGSTQINAQNNYGLITYPRQYFGPVNIEKLQIQLLDEYGRILNLNNMDYSFCLTLQTIYNL
jgi:hypothetical protein